MFGRGRRKARAAQAIEVQVEAPAAVVAAAPEAAAPSELDTTFMAMMAQLDDSLAAMARACDRIEQAVAVAGRSGAAEADTVAAA